MVKKMKIDLAIQTQYQHVTDRRTPHDSKVPRYTERRAGKKYSLGLGSLNERLEITIFTCNSFIILLLILIILNVSNYSTKLTRPT